MVPGVDIELLILTAMHDGTDVDPQELLATTQMLPPLVPEDRLTDVVPWPLFMDQPVGTVQVYDVAPGTAVIL
jgi:hypothetical protein